MIAIIVHGGAGKIRNLEAHRKGTRHAAEKGYQILKQGGSALEASTEAVRVMEDDHAFNAGTGSYPNLMGEIEMDASVMLDSGEFGAVGSIKNVRHPIDVALKVMENTDHLLLVGNGAERFARLYDFEYHNPLIPKMEKRLKALKKKKESPYLRNLDKLLSMFEKGTVGACALDSRGRIAVATSTGGILGKLPGRIGDSAIIGAGTYATKYGGVSTTGHGEGIMKIFAAKSIVELMARYKPDEAIRIFVEEGKKLNVRFGAIGIDKYGNVGFGYNTESMSYAFIV